jgi:hypothetical protein
MAYAKLDEGGLAPRRHSRLERRLDFRQIIGMNELENAVPRSLGRQEAEQSLNRRTVEEDLSSQVDERDEIDRVLDDRQTMLIAAHGRVFRAFSRGDVEHHAAES